MFQSYVRDKSSCSYKGPQSANIHPRVLCVYARRSYTVPAHPPLTRSWGFKFFGPRNKYTVVFFSKCVFSHENICVKNLTVVHVI